MVKRITIISLVLILVASGVFYLKQKTNQYPSCKKTTKFNSQQWIENENIRYCMIEDIIKSKILLNKSKREIKELLGKPFSEGEYYSGESLHYKTTVSANEHLTWYLFVELKKDTVVYVQKSAD